MKSNRSWQPQLDLKRDKSVRLGELPLITMGKSVGLPNLDRIKGEIVFPSTFFIFNRDNRYTVTDSLPLSISEFVPESTGICIYFDTDTGQIYLVSQVIMTGITESSILLGVAYKQFNEWWLNINCDYTINGKPRYPTYEQWETLHPTPDICDFSVEKLFGDYPQADLFGVLDEGSVFNTIVDHNLIYNLFDDLMSSNTSYITKEEIGLSTNSVPIYCYHFKPEAISLTGIKPYPKILMDSSIHGGERMGTYTLYYFMKSICDNWQNNKGLEYLRHYVNFSIVPLPNPEDFTSEQYIGLGGINLNRDFDANWVEQEGSGTAPFQRIESQIMRDFLNENTDALMFVDCHVRGGLSVSDDEIMWMDGGDDKNTKLIIKTTIEKMTQRWKQKYDNLSNVEGLLGHATVTTSGVGTIRSYAQNVIGIPSILWEGFRNSTSINVFEGKQVVDMNVEYMGETLFNIIKKFQ